MKRLIQVFLALGVALCLMTAAAAAAPPKAIPTNIMIRAVAHDAKVIGDHVGGARITIRDLTDGRILAQGIQKGETGDTQRIMIDPRQRGRKVFDTPGTAGFLATLDLTGPTPVEISAEGPLAFPQALQKVSTTLLLIPGHDVLGDGIVLEIYGLIVTIEQPEKGAHFKAGSDFKVRARLTMT